MRTSHKLFVAALLMTLVSACSTTAVREHLKMAAELGKIHNVVIIPPSVTIEKIMFTGENERMTDQKATLAPKIMDLGRDLLAKHGYTVVAFDFDKATKDDPDLAFALSQPHDAYLQAHKKLYKQMLVPTSKKQAIAASTGATANLIADKTGADALLLINYKGYVKSGGEMAKEATASVLLAVLTLGNAVVVPVSGQSQVEAAMIDGNTGDVLWSNIQGGAGANEDSASATLASIPQEPSSTTAMASSPATTDTASSQAANERSTNAAVPPSPAESDLPKQPKPRSQQ